MSIIPQYSQKDFLRTYQKLGLVIETKSSKGSHVKVRNPHEGGFVLVPYKIKKGLDARLIKELEGWGFARDEIIELLR